ncbi:MAG: MiaB/RimO family radical SAM methylthiotransferase [Anaerolineales bacterium]|nr:MiaB/RimO family radical SAM methylthiotransferase [Chloroflexota bacterium]MBL6982157.1 MiaB/RimO family radical SAM methylthiotransferase [Anaerolineales bacterium]
MKVYLDTVGCRLNQSEIETFARQFRLAGHTLVSDPAEADLTVINTCTVTTAAAADSRKKIRGATRAGSGEVIATGCWATMEPQMAATLSGVSQVVSNIDKDNLVSQYLQLPSESFDLEPVEREPIPGARTRTRAFIKVQDGCDNRCTFCITTVARGGGVSRPTADIIKDIQSAYRGGVQEAVLTGVHLGSWGYDFENATHLKRLVDIILRETDIPRLRLSSLEPWDLEEDFFSLWENKRLARHLHLPLQSGCAATLRRMARKTTPEEYAKLIANARLAIPELAITTDVIVGFPIESDIEFEESLSFVNNMNFAGGHVFTYSARPETAAARMPDHVPHDVRKDRNAQMRAIFSATKAAYQEQFLGENISVLWESATALGSDGWHLNGLTDNYLRVRAEAPMKLWNKITPVKITEVTTQGLIGRIL